MIVILTIDTIINGVFYLQESNKLKEAQVEIAGLEGDVTALEGNLTTVEGDVSILEGDITTPKKNMLGQCQCFRSGG